MKVLVVHNKYSSLVPSGENASVENEARWLRQAGVDVSLHEVSNDDLIMGSLGTKAKAALETIWSPSAGSQFKQVLNDTKPDLVHVHNLFPLLTASVPAIGLRADIPVVWTVRNLRVVCVDGTHFRDGQPCHACRPGWRVPGVLYGCYRDSRIASGLVTGATSLFRRIARRRITTIAISQHIRNWLIESAGFDADSVRVKYNGVAQPSGITVPDATTRNTFLFAAKLAEYKGVSLLLDAWNRLPELDAKLRIVGDGPLADRVQTAATADSRITWIGQISPDDMGPHLADARAVIVPSTWEEPFGRTAAEALAFGRPVITTGLGGLCEVTDEASGWLTGTDPRTIATAIQQAATSDEAIVRRSTAAKTRHSQLFSPTTTTDALIQIYEAGISRTTSSDSKSRGL